MSADTTDAKKCNGGAGYNNSAGAKTHNIAKRIGVKANTASIDVGGTALTYTWNEDILLASLYQSSVADDTLITTGASWCSKWMTTLADAGTASTLSATNGWNGRTKCTWQVRSPKASMGPVLKLKSASTSDMYINWMEWSDPNGLGTNAVLGLVDGASFYIGAYAVTADQVWLNPVTGGVTDSTWSISSLAWYYDVKDPATYVPGSIGPVVYYPAAAGD